MLEKIIALRSKFNQAKTEAEEIKIQEEMDALREQDPDAWANAMVESLKQVNDNLSNDLMRDKLEDILPYISVSQLAKEYFGKTPQWFYQRMNGNIVNGKPAKFTREEIRILNNALQDLSKKIGSLNFAV